MSNSKPQFVYFGGEPLGVPVLEKLQEADLLPRLIVTSPDRKRGRGHQLTPPPVKVWANDHGIPVIQPTSFSDPDAPELSELLETEDDLFVVVAYNHILPTWLINRPKHATLNVHPSLLPKYRGPSPIRSAILADDSDVGVSIIKLDEKMDHGPIVAQEKVPIAPDNWPPYGPELDQQLADCGGRLLARVVPQWVTGSIAPTPQDHANATYTTKFDKRDAELALDPHDLPRGVAARTTLLKIRALAGQPDAYFFHNDQRVKITRAHIENDTLVVERVIPAGKNEMSFTDYLAYTNNSTK